MFTRISHNPTDVYCLSCDQLSHDAELTGRKDTCPKCDVKDDLVWADSREKDEHGNIRIYLDFDDL